MNPSYPLMTLTRAFGRDNTEEDAIMIATDIHLS